MISPCICASTNYFYVLSTGGAGYFFPSQWYITFAQITPPKYSQAHMIPAETPRGALGKKNANTKLSTPTGINTAHRKLPIKRPIVPRNSSILKGFSVNAFMTAIRAKTANAISDSHMQACILSFFITTLRCAYSGVHFDSSSCLSLGTKVCVVVPLYA